MSTIVMKTMLVLSLSGSWCGSSIESVVEVTAGAFVDLMPCCIWLRCPIELYSDGLTKRRTLAEVKPGHPWK